MFESLGSRERNGFPAFDVESVREWSQVHKRQLLAAGAAIAVGLVAVVVTLGPASARTPVELSLPRASAPPVSIVAPMVIVHVSGAVAEPGVFRVDPGARVGDLVDVAGGFTPAADPDRVNLAAVVRDGDQVHIPELDEVTPADAAAGTGGRVDLNRAGLQALQTLPGIGPALAAAIVEHRERFGNFRDVESLENVSGIGPAKLDGIRDLVTV